MRNEVIHQGRPCLEALDKDKEGTIGVVDLRRHFRRWPSLPVLLLCKIRGSSTTNLCSHPCSLGAPIQRRQISGEADRRTILTFTNAIRSLHIG
ncbi:hypothetical protein SISSUDRAFT_341995 [Sistotremastrum suecicum HHB10207 ss-3]|uniref:EF-hand domain-containing protein n=1 Tax=Sistotremastrum suecicum HHB10207 ss-3 TaxID=1314776 RepID=A0A166IYG3_9AGAM|nr:hypothetical protein SISSUDRAFT_341995 [Sistotremastrum suecicum HHB10207 ss-3]